MRNIIYEMSSMYIYVQPEQCYVLAAHLFVFYCFTMFKVYKKLSVQFRLLKVDI